MFLTKKVYTCRDDLCHVGGENNKKKAEWSVFFLVGLDFSSSEESSTVKYSECALSLFVFSYLYGIVVVREATTFNVRNEVFISVHFPFMSVFYVSFEWHG